MHVSFANLYYAILYLGRIFIWNCVFNRNQYGNLFDFYYTIIVTLLTVWAPSWDTSAEFEHSPRDIMVLSRDA